jgi:hypothetical protein
MEEKLNLDTWTLELTWPVLVWSACRSFPVTHRWSRIPAHIRYSQAPQQLPTSARLHTQAIQGWADWRVGRKVQSEGNTESPKTCHRMEQGGDPVHWSRADYTVTIANVESEKDNISGSWIRLQYPACSRTQIGFVIIALCKLVHCCDYQKVHEPAARMHTTTRDVYNARAQEFFAERQRIE